MRLGQESPTGNPIYNYYISYLKEEKWRKNGKKGNVQGKPTQEEWC